MDLFDKEYREDLVEINKRLETTIDSEIKEELLGDKEYILSVLYPNKSKKKFQYTNKESKQEILNMINNIDQIRFMTLKKIRCLNNNARILELFNNFIANDEFKLKTTLKNIESYNGIRYIKKIDSIYGTITYISSLKRNHILICKTDNIYQYSTLVHELGHAKINLLSNKFNKNSKKSYLEESYPIFLELVFSDFLKNNGMIKQAYKIKNLIFKQIKQSVINLKNEYYKYLSYNENDIINRFFYEYQHRLLKCLLLGLQFYYMYLENPVLTCYKIDEFINNIYKISDNDLLKLMNIDINFYSNKNINKMYIELKQQKLKVKCK